MGTRADFYVGRGESAEWLGSVAFDGYPDRRLPELECADEAGYRAAVAKILEADHATHPSDGWPWPWLDSHTTDYAYAFDGGDVWTSNFGYRWLTRAEALDHERDDDEEPKRTVFPNMKDRQNVTFGRRSGILIFGLRGPAEH